jgi:hypothetical protein
MQISMHKRQEIECSGHNLLHHNLNYISLLSLGKTELWRWNFHTVTVLASQYIHEWRSPEQILIQIWRTWITQMNMVNECKHSKDGYWSRIMKPILQRRCRDKWESLCSCTAWGEETSREITVPYSQRGMLLALVRKFETGLERVRWLSREFRNTVLVHSMRRGDPPRKSSLQIRSAEFFSPLHKSIGV